MSSSTVTLTYSKPGTIPPIFVAGSFSSPSWEPQELDQVGKDDSARFSKTFDLSPGTYQYKFRLGTGDWWVVDETEQQATDDQGNVNNVLIVEDSPEGSAPSQLAKDSLVHTDTAYICPDVQEEAPGPAVSVSEISGQARDLLVTPLSETVPAVATNTSASASALTLSHELPTPPLSEGGDEVDSKDAAAPAARATADKAGEEAGGKEADSRRSEKDELRSVISTGWSRAGVIGIALAVFTVPLVAWALSL